MNNLIQACQRCEPAAQKLLYEKHVDRLYYTLQRYTNDRFDTENLLQDVFIKIFNKIDTYDPQKGSFKAWSGTIAVHTAINHCRKKRWDYSFVDELQSVENDASDLSFSHLELQDLLAVIGSIDEKYGVVFNLYVIDGYSHDEIAQMLDIAAATSRSSLTRAKKLLREKISKAKLQYYG